MQSSCVTGSVAGAPFAGTSRLPRSRSAEDLSQEQLKTTESDTVLIFIEYVRNKLDKTTLRAGELDAELEAEARKRRGSRSSRGDAGGGGRARESLRRLQSEPNGPQGDESGRDDANWRRVPATCEVAAPRPAALVLDRPPSNRDERRHRASLSATARSISTASPGSNTIATTTTPSTFVSAGLSCSAATPVPVPDPPLCVAGSGISPTCGDEGDFSASYPPLSTHRLHTVSSPAITVPPVVAGLPVSQEYFCAAQQPLTPQLARAVGARDSKWRRQHHAKLIANKLKIFGDELSSTHEEQLQREFSHLFNTNLNPQQVIQFFSFQLRQMVLGLSWQNIGKVFHLSYHLIEILSLLLGPSADSAGSREWADFSDLWDFTIGSVTRWISSHGGWRAFPADPAISTPTPSPDQPSCPATPSFQRVRSRLLSLSESGEFEFIDEEGQPLSADTISTTSSEIAMSDDREDQMGSSVDLLHDHLEESASESSLTASPPYLPATLTPVTVPPPCAPPTLYPTSHAQNHTPSSPKKHPKQKSKSKTSSATSASSTVAFSNGIAQLPTQLSLQTQRHSPPHSRTLPKRRNHSVKEHPRNGTGVTSNEGEMEGGLSRTGSLPGGGIRRSASESRRRTSQTAFNGLMIGVGGAAVVYAAVSALMRR